MDALKILCFSLALNYAVSVVAISDEDSVIADKIISNLSILKSVLSTADTTLLSMKTIQSNLINTTSSIVDQNKRDIKLRVAAMKQDINKVRSKRSSSLIDKCIDEEQPLDILVEAISDQIKQCITVALAENVNIISGCIVEAQSFMDLPQKVAADLQTCGPSQKCLLQLSIDAVKESMEIPSKVLVLTARVQQLAYHSVSTINGCALNGLLDVVKQGISIAEDIVACVEESS